MTDISSEYSEEENAAIIESNLDEMQSERLESKIWAALTNLNVEHFDSLLGTVLAGKYFRNSL